MDTESEELLLEIQSDSSDNGYLSAGTDEDEATYRCRICLDDIFPDRDLDQILSPCCCTGSMTFIHSECFRKAQQNKCELCGLRFFAQEAPFENPRQFRQNGDDEDIVFEFQLPPHINMMNQDNNQAGDQAGDQAGEEPQEATIWDRLVTPDAIAFHGLGTAHVGMLRFLVEQAGLFSLAERMNFYYVLECYLPNIGFWNRMKRVIYFKYYMLIPRIDLSTILVGINLLFVASLMSITYQIDSRIRRVGQRIRDFRNFWTHLARSREVFDRFFPNR